MTCDKCQVCERPIRKDDSGKKRCLPVIIGDPATRTRHCWCVCDDCRPDFINRSAKAVKELERAGR